MAKVLCFCKRCGFDQLGVPDDPCPNCKKGTLEKDWTQHMSIESDFSSGHQVLVTHRSQHPLTGKYCSLHRTQE